MLLEVGDDRPDGQAGVVGQLTSTGTKLRSVPAARSASSSSRVLSAAPAPSSTSVLAPVAAAISPATATRMDRSARVG
jgi:hypothetical protein